jgi:hypothetical protein
MSNSLNAPGDRRRFVHFMNQIDLKFEIAYPDKIYDLVIITQAADLSKWKEYNKGKLIFDLPDAYLQEEFSIKRALRGTAKYLTGQNKNLNLSYLNLIKEMALNSDGVITSSTIDSVYFNKINKKNWIIYDSAYEFINIVKKDYKNTEVVSLLWEGLPTSLKSFGEISQVLNELSEKRKIKIYLLTDLNYYKYLNNFILTESTQEAKRWLKNVEFQIMPWNLNNMASLIKICDIALVPMNKSKIYYYKPPNRTIFFMKMKMPVLGGSSFAHAELAKTVGEEFYAETENRWKLKLNNYLDSEALRNRDAEKNYTSINSLYSEATILKKWANAFDEVLNSNYFSSKLEK